MSIETRLEVSRVCATLLAVNCRMARLDGAHASTFSLFQSARPIFLNDASLKFQ